MEKKSFSSKKVLILIFSVCVVFLAGCKKTSQIESIEEMRRIEKLKSVTFELTQFNMTGKSELYGSADFYYPEELEQFLNRVLIYNGSWYLFAERFDNSRLGIIEGSTFCDELDNCDWVDELLIKIEEERIADEIQDMEEALDDNMESVKDEAKEIEKKLSNEIETRELLNTKNDLIFMEYDNEIFIPQKTNFGWYITQSVDSKVTRTKYDNEFRVLERENWNISSAENAQIESKEILEYFDDSYKVNNKVVESKENIQKYHYNSDGLVTKLENYKLVDEKKYIISITERVYDDDQRILVDEKTEYNYKNEYKKLDYKFNKKYKYCYNADEEIPPDVEYFENGELKMTNKYSQRKGTYTTQIFFEGGFSVKTLYVDDLRSRDIYYLNNEVTRIKVYEN